MCVLPRLRHVERSCAQVPALLGVVLAQHSVKCRFVRAKPQCLAAVDDFEIGEIRCDAGACRLERIERHKHLFQITAQQNDSPAVVHDGAANAEIAAVGGLENRQKFRHAQDDLRPHLRVCEQLLDQRGVVLHFAGRPCSHVRFPCGGAPCPFIRPLDICDKVSEGFPRRTQPANLAPPVVDRARASEQPMTDTRIETPLTIKAIFEGLRNVGPYHPRRELEGVARPSTLPTSSLQAFSQPFSVGRDGCPGFLALAPLGGCLLPEAILDDGQ